MDAFVQLALIEKSRRVFGCSSPNTFLSFPILAPLNVSLEQVGAISAPQTASDFAFAADFARQMNFLPRDIVAGLEGDRYLWDVYGDVLTRAIVAKGSASSGGSGTSILFDVNPDGTRVESAIYRAYRQYRDAWIVACESYASHKSTGELSADPAERQHWIDVDEPALRAAVAAAESDWQNLGHRQIVDAALLAESSGSTSSPLVRWKEWSDAFNPDIDLLTDASGRYAPTGVSPRDFASSDTWPVFEMTSSEMAVLVQEAPETLRAMLGGEHDTTVDRISFEFRSVAVVRPWFRPDALTSRLWRSDDPDLRLSDGATPPSGACPAYVSALVFMRNLVVTQRSGTTEVPPSGFHFTIPSDLLTKRSLRWTPATDPPLETLIVPQQDIRSRAFQRLDTQSFTVAPTNAFATPVRNIGISKLKSEVLVSRDSVAAASPSIKTAPLNRRILSTLASGSRLQLLRDVAGEVVTPSNNGAPSPQPASPVTQLSVLAFVCKRLPKTPDARPDLVWAG